MVVPLFQSKCFKKDLQEFASKVQTLDGTEKLAEQDFEMISRLGLKVLDKISNNPKVDCPVVWNQIFTICENKGSFKSLVSWLTGLENSNAFERSFLFSLYDLASYLGDEGKDQILNSMRFLQNSIIQPQNLTISNQILECFAAGIQIGNDSLIMNFVDCFTMGDEEEFALLFTKTLGHFPQLKVLSISNLRSSKISSTLIEAVLKQSSKLLKQLTLINVKISNSSEEKAFILPNIQRLEILQFSTKKAPVKWTLKFGNKLIWHDAPEVFVEACSPSEYKDTPLRMKLDFFESWDFPVKSFYVEYAKEHPDLECFNFFSELYVDHNRHEGDFNLAFKELPKLKKLTLEMDETLEQLNVSNQIEALRLSCIAGGLIDIDWTHLRTFQNLRHLELIDHLDVDENNYFFDFLREDRLEFLAIDTQCLYNTQIDPFFSALSNCKKLKFLDLGFSDFEDIILPQCVEALYFVLVCREQGSSLSKIMPNAPGVRFLYFGVKKYHFSFKKDYNLADLKKYFPKLERAKCKDFKATEDLDFYFTRDVEEPLCDYFLGYNHMLRRFLTG